MSFTAKKLIEEWHTELGYDKPDLISNDLIALIEYVLSRTANPYKYDFKDQSPIRFEFFQSDVEKIMFALGEVQKVIALTGLGQAKEYLNGDKHNDYDYSGLLRLITNIKDDFQHKIDIHREKDEWK